MQAFAPFLPTMVGGSADLDESVKTGIKADDAYSRERAGRNVSWGVREHAMGAAVNGLRAPRRDRQALRRDVPPLRRLHARRRSGSRR